MKRLRNRYEETEIDRQIERIRDWDRKLDS